MQKKFTVKNISKSENDKALRINFCTVIFFIVVLTSLDVFSQAVYPLSFYIEAAEKNSPLIKENLNRLTAGMYQASLIRAQISAPQAGIAGDYLFAPFFNSHGKPVEVTNTPSENATGYDLGITNGGLYSALFNITVPVLTKHISGPLFQQNKILLSQLSIEQLALKHELEKNVTDLYVSALQLQQQVENTADLAELLDERIMIVKKLVEKGLISGRDYLLLQIEKENKENEISDLKMKFRAAIVELNNTSGISDTGTVKLELLSLKMTEKKSTFNYIEKYIADSTYNANQQRVFNVKYFPQLNVFGNTGLNASYAPDIPHNIGVSAGVHLLVPVYDGRQRKINENLTRINQQILADNKTGTALRLTNNLQLLESQVSEKRQIIALQETQLKQYASLLEIYKAQVVNGQLSVIDFVNLLEKYKTAIQTVTLSRTELLLLISQYNYLNW